MFIPLGFQDVIGRGFFLKILFFAISCLMCLFIQIPILFWSVERIVEFVSCVNWENRLCSLLILLMCSIMYLGTEINILPHSEWLDCIVSIQFIFHPKAPTSLFRFLIQILNLLTNSTYKLNLRTIRRRTKIL